MGWFDRKNKTEQEKQEAFEAGKQEAIRDNYMGLSNLSKGSQVNFAIPYFDVFDPRFMDHGVPMAVHGSIVYSIDDMDAFHQINKNEAYTDETFKNKLKGMVTKFVKGVVTNAPSDQQIPVLQIERRILEISELVQRYVVPKVEQIFAINVRSLDITDINVDKESYGYRALYAVTSELERQRTIQQHNISMEMQQQQHERNQEMQELQTVERMRMQMEDQRERLRIQRDGIEMHQEQQIKDGRFGRTMGGGMMGGNPMIGGTPTMGNMAPPPMMSAQYYVGINGQQMGPFDVNILRQMVQQGQISGQTQVWTQGMPQWAPAGAVPELATLFASQPIGMTPPPMGGGTPPPMDGGNTPAPTL